MLNYLRPAPWYISVPVVMVISCVFGTLLSGYMPPKQAGQAGIDWNQIWFAGGVGALAVAAKTPIDYFFNKWNAERDGGAAR